MYLNLVLSFIFQHNQLWVLHRQDSYSKHFLSFTRNAEKENNKHKLTIVIIQKLLLGVGVTCVTSLFTRRPGNVRYTPKSWVRVFLCGQVFWDGDNISC